MSRSTIRALGLRIAAPFVLAAGLASIVWPLWHVHTAVAVMLLALALVIGGSLWIGRDRPIDPGIGEVLARDDQALLWRMIDGTAEATGSKAPREIYLTDGVRAALAARTVCSGLVNRGSRLEIGAGLFGSLDTEELRALVVALLEQHSGAGGRLVRCRVALAETALRLEGNRLGALWLRYYHPIIESLDAVVNQQVLDGDRKAAELTSRAAIIGGLSRLYMGGAAHDLYVREYLTPLWATGCTAENMFEGLRHFGAEPSRADFFEEIHLALRDMEPMTEGVVGIADRLRVLESLPADETEAVFAEPSEDLLSDRVGLEVALSAKVAERMTGVDSLELVGWDEYASRLADIEVVRAVQFSRACSDVSPMDDDAGSLRHSLRTASSVAREDIASRLMPLAKTLLPPERQPVYQRALRSHIKAAIGSALVDHADHRWELRWSGDAALVGPGGAEVDLEMWVDGVLNGGVGIPALFDWFETVGVPVAA